jgi:hypothetical protein
MVGTVFAALAGAREFVGRAKTGVMISILRLRLPRSLAGL